MGVLQGFVACLVCLAQEGLQAVVGRVGSPGISSTFAHEVTTKTSPTGALSLGVHRHTHTHRHRHSHGPTAVQTACRVNKARCVPGPAGAAGMPGVAGYVPPTAADGAAGKDGGAGRAGSVTFIVTSGGEEAKER